MDLEEGELRTFVKSQFEKRFNSTKILFLCKKLMYKKKVIICNS